MPVRWQPLVGLGLIGLVLMGLGLVTGGSIEQVLVIPLVLIVPGFAVTAALFQRKELKLAELLLLSLGLSLALIVLGGIVLDWTPWGLQTLSWALLLGGISLVAGGIAYFRYGRNSFLAFGIKRRNLRFDRASLRPLLLFTLAGLIIVAALIVSRQSALTQPTPGFTQLWLLPVARPGDSAQLKLGFVNREGQAVTYRLQVKSGSTVVQEWPAITLNPDAQWEIPLAVPADLHSGDKLEADLYRADKPDTLYRQVTYNLP